MTVVTPITTLRNCDKILAFSRQKRDFKMKINAGKNLS